MVVVENYVRVMDYCAAICSDQCVFNRASFDGQRTVGIVGVRGPGYIVLGYNHPVTVCPLRVILQVLRVEGSFLVVSTIVDEGQRHAVRKTAQENC